LYFVHVVSALVGSCEAACVHSNGSSCCRNNSRVGAAARAGASHDSADENVAGKHN